MPFDPYLDWLEIPKDRRPPNHYQLLGVSDTEGDPEVIKASYRRRYTLVRNYELSNKHGDDATRILGELSNAMSCLTDETARQVYDRQLRGLGSATPGADEPSTQRSACPQCGCGLRIPAGFENERLCCPDCAARLQWSSAEQRLTPVADEQRLTSVPETEWEQATSTNSDEFEPLPPQFPSITPLASRNSASNRSRDSQPWSTLKVAAAIEQIKRAADALRRPQPFATKVGAVMVLAIALGIGLVRLFQNTSVQSGAVTTATGDQDTKPSEPAPRGDNVPSVPAPLFEPEPTPAPPRPLAHAPFDATYARTSADTSAAQAAWAKHLGRQVVVSNGIEGMELVLIPAGEFLMGSPGSDSEPFTNEKPQHRVQITKPYYLQTTEVTQGQWNSVMHTEPWKRENFVKGGELCGQLYQLGRRTSVLYEAESDGRRTVPLADGSRVGIRLPGWDGDAFQFWRLRKQTGRLRLVR